MLLLKMSIYYKSISVINIDATNNRVFNEETGPNGKEKYTIQQKFTGDVNAPYTIMGSMLNSISVLYLRRHSHPVFPLLCNTEQEALFREARQEKRNKNHLN